MTLNAAPRNSPGSRYFLTADCGGIFEASDIGTGDELVAGETGGRAGDLVDEIGDLGIFSAATGPSVATEGEAGFAVAVVLGKQVAVAGAGVVGRATLLGGERGPVAGEDEVAEV